MTTFRRPGPILSALLTVAATLSSTVAHAAGPTVFGAVSSYEVQYNLMTITGVPVGAGAAITVSADVSASAGQVFDTCERDLLVMLNRPGRFTLTVTTSPSAQLLSCTLTQSP